MGQIELKGYLNMQNKNNVLLGIFCVILSMSCSSGLALAFQKSGDTSRVIQTTITSFFAAIIAGITLLILKGPKGFVRKSNVKWYVIRSVLTGFGMWTWMYSAKALGPNETTLVFYTTPIWTLVVAAYFRMERIKARSVIGVTICISSIVGCLYHSLNNFNSALGFAIALLSAGCFGCYDVVCRKQGETGEHSLTQSFYAFLITAVLLLPIAIYYAIVSKVDVNDIMMCIMVSPLRVGIAISIFLAYKLAPISILTPISYMRLPVMMLMSYLVSGEIPNGHTVLAGTIIIVTNIALLTYANIKEKQAISVS